MDAHRSRSLGTAALIFILISLTAAVFHGAAPVRADDATTPTPIVIDETTADVTVKLYTDENHTQELSGPVTSASHFYGAFSAKFLNGKEPSAGNNVAEYKFPDTIVVDDNNGGELLAGTGTDQAKAGMWKMRVIGSYLRLTRAGLRITLRISLSGQISRLSLQTRTAVQAAARLSCFPVT